MSRKSLLSSFAYWLEKSSFPFEHIPKVAFLFVPTITVDIHVCAQSLSRVLLFVTPWTVAARLPLSPGKDTGVGCQFLLQGIFLTQELNQRLLHCRWILYQLSCREVIPQCILAHLWFHPSYVSLTPAPISCMR